MKFNLLTLTLRNFIAAFSGGAARIAGPANKLLALLIVIEVVLIGLWWALDGGERLSAIFKKLLYLCFWIWVVREFPMLSKAFVDSLVSAGQLAAGGNSDSSLLLDPSKIAGYGLDATEPLAKKLEELHIIEPSDVLIFGAAYLGIVACFVIMAVQVFLAVVEYYMIVALVVILLPFGILQSTRFIAEKAIGAVVAAGIKLMVLSFILASVEPVLKSSLKFSGDDIGMNEVYAMFMTVCAVMLLTWKAPQLASGLLSGHPSLGAGDAAAPVAAAVGAAVGMATGGASTFAARAAAGAAGAAGAGGLGKTGEGKTDGPKGTADAAKQGADASKTTSSVAPIWASEPPSASKGNNQGA